MNSHLCSVFVRLAATLNRQKLGVTAVLTSCGRHHLLEQTLQSFFRLNSFPLRKLIVVEDGESFPPTLIEKFHNQPIDWIATGERVGQIAAIDYAYSRVQTPFIFHLEDDWEFYAPDFIEKSLLIMLAQPKCIQVWLRALNDTNNHPIEPREFVGHCARWQKLRVGYNNQWGEWNGFSFNPGLRRLADYRLTGGYGNLAEFDFDQPGSAESKIGAFYKEREFFAAILSDRSASGYVRHIGIGQHVDTPSQRHKI